MNLQSRQQVRNTQAKLAMLEESRREVVASGQLTHADELTLASLNQLIRQLKEEIAVYEAHHPAGWHCWLASSEFPELISRRHCCAKPAVAHTETTWPSGRSWVLRRNRHAHRVALSISPKRSTSQLCATAVAQTSPALDRANDHRTRSVIVEPQPQPTGVPQQPSATTFSRPAPPFSTVANSGTLQPMESRRSVASKPLVSVSFQAPSSPKTNCSI